MDLRKLVTKVLSAAMAGTMLLSMGTMYSSVTITADAADLCVVNTDKTYQRIRGFGGMNHPEWQSYKGGGDMTDAQIQTAFGNGDGQLGLTVLRIFVSDNSNEWKNAIPTAQKAQKLGATVFATPWNPPAAIRHSGSGGAKGGKYVLNDGADAEKAYAKHLNDFVKYCDSQGVHLNSISVQNEPDFAEDWTAWTPDRAASFIANYGKAVVAGTNTKLMSPESFQYSPESWGNGKAYYAAIMKNSQAMANCDMFGTHFYGTQRSWMDYPALKNTGKEIWMTEVYVPNSDHDANEYPMALDVSENIHNGLVVGGMNAYVWWYIRRSYGLMTEDGKVSKRGYCLAQYSKYVRPGDVRIDATESPANNILISAYKHSDTQIEIVAINKNDSDVQQQFSVGSRVITDVDRYRTSANENLAKTNDLEHADSTYWANLPAKSVSTFVVTLKSDGKPLPSDPSAPVPQEPITPDSNGYYYHDTFENGTDDWEARGGTSLVMSGRVPYAGTNAMLIQDRGSAWHGAQKTLDALTFKGGEAYSFSVNAYYDGEDAPESQDLMLSLQYTDSAGETKYGHIAQATAYKGHYVQLANTNYTIPSGATNPILYVESAEGSTSFYIDESIVAVKGTKIAGAEPYVPPTEPKTEPTTEPTTEPSTTKPETVLPGDLNFDGRVDVFDLALAKRGLVSGFKDDKAKTAADVDGSGQVQVSDIIMIAKYIHKTLTKFPVDSLTVETKSMDMASFTAACQSKLTEYEPASSHQEVSGTQYGTLQSGKYYSTTCKREKPFNILLPAGYSTSKQYPVLYVMHGYWEDQDRMCRENMGTRQIIGNLIASGEAKDMIVVFPYIYSSDTQAACSGMDDFNNAAYDNFINDLTKDLMPYIEQNYSVKSGRDDTAITGFSMGGRESLLIGMQRSDLFGYVGAICPAPGVTGAFKWDSGKEPYLVMITAGSNDTVVYDTPKPYHESFEANGVPHIWHYVNGGAHGDNSIVAHLYNFARFVFQATE